MYQGRIYHKKVKEDGYVFDSEMEYLYYLHLKSRLEEDEISNLQVHPSYLLLDNFKNANGKLHKAITYEPDFVYFDLDDCKTHYVDVKGFLTEEFALKWKLFDKFLIDNCQGCFLEVLKYSKTTGFVPIEKYKQEMKTRRAKLIEEKNYYKNIVLKRQHDEEVAARKEERERVRYLELIKKQNEGIKLTKQQRDRYEQLRDKYGGDFYL